LKWALYNILFALVYPFLLPGFLVRMLRRGGYAARMGDRFTLYPPEVMAKFIPDGKPVCPHGKVKRKKEKGKSADGSSLPAALYPLPSVNYIWIHAVSVGEVQVAGQLMREWRKVEPDVRFCFSTTSSTGWRMAEREITERDVLIYNPLDFPNFVKSALKTVRPRAIVLTESEIWPNFILTAKRYGIPLFLINARVSDRSAPRYKLARFFFKDVLSAFTRIFAQSELDKRRLVAAGAPAERVDVTGSFKFDVAKRNEAKEAELREWIFGEQVEGGEEAKVRGEGKKSTVQPSTSNLQPVLLGGSTWPGEDEVLLKIYKKILTTVQPPTCNLQPVLVIAPRHFEKADAVEENIHKHGFACVRRSRGDRRPATGNQQQGTVFLCDTTGEMMGLFGICDVAFVGKSLCAHGSQNMIEPCLCGKPTVVGPHTENFRPVMSDLLESNAIVQVPDEAKLEETILRWFAEGDGGLGARAAAAVANRRGVVPRCVAEIRKELKV